MTASTPFFHSLVFVNAPNNSSEVTAFGLRVSYSQSSPLLIRTRPKVFHTQVFPLPGGPITKQQWRTSRISKSYTTFKTKRSFDSAISPIFYLAVSITFFFRLGSVFYGASALGKSALIKFKKIGLSSVTIFGMLKSRSALIRRGSSLMSGSERLSLPAWRNTDLTARRPQS